MRCIREWWIRQSVGIWLCSTLCVRVCVCVCVCARAWAPKALLPKGNGWDVVSMGAGRRLGPDTDPYLTRNPWFGVGVCVYVRMCALGWWGRGWGRVYFYVFLSVWDAFGHRSCQAYDVHQ